MTTGTFVGTPVSDLAEYAQARSWNLQAGDNFTEADVRNANKVCLRSERHTAKTLFREGVNPVGPGGFASKRPLLPLSVGWRRRAAGSRGQDQDGDDPNAAVMKRLSEDTRPVPVHLQSGIALRDPQFQNRIGSLRTSASPDRRGDGRCCHGAKTSRDEPTFLNADRTAT